MPLFPTVTFKCSIGRITGHSLGVDFIASSNSASSVEAGIVSEKTGFIAAATAQTFVVGLYAGLEILRSTLLISTKLKQVI